MHLPDCNWIEYRSKDDLSFDLSGATLSVKGAPRAMQMSRCIEPKHLEVRRLEDRTLPHEERISDDVREILSP